MCGPLQKNDMAQLSFFTGYSHFSANQLQRAEDGSEQFIAIWFCNRLMPLTLFSFPLAL